MPATRLLQKLCSAANTELHQGKGGVLSQLVTKCFPSNVQQQSSGVQQLYESGDWAHSNKRHQHFLSKEEQDLLRSAAHFTSSSSSYDDPSHTSTSSSSSSPGGPTAGSRRPITPSCDVPPDHLLHELYRNRQQPIVTTGSNTALYKLPSRIENGSVTAEEFQRSCSSEDHVLSRFYEEGVHGGLGRRFRRKVPLFQVGVDKSCCGSCWRTWSGLCAQLCADVWGLGTSPCERPAAQLSSFCAGGLPGIQEWSALPVKETAVTQSHM